MKEQILKMATKDHFKEIVENWKMYWMSQRQNSKEDYENYWRRAFGVDANMMHSLADMIAKDPLIQLMAECLEKAETLIGHTAHPTQSTEYDKALDRLKQFLGNA